MENRYAYDAFGNLLGQEEAFPNRILYAGQLYDQETGQYYLRARYYNPTIGRFSQEDTYWGDGLNLYAYCANNPVRYFDPSGHQKKPNCPGTEGEAATDKQPGVEIESSRYSLPQGISQEQFSNASKLLRDRVGDISGDIVVQGSRAKGTAKPTSDIDIASADGNTIPWELLTTIREMDGVKEVYGRRSVFDVSAKLNDDTNFSGTVDLISYDDFDLQCLKKDSALKRGSDLSKVFGDSNFVLATSDQDSTWKIGDTVQIGDETLTIAGLLKNDPFSENGLTNGKLTLITSDETFVRLTGEEGYSLVLIQTTGDVTDENVQAIQNSVDQTYSFRDKRDERTTGTYMAFVFCVYAFLAIIALVTVMNIVNSISMSVSARMKQYGAMRAVGMDERQMTKMIACEAFTYAVLGCVVGCAIGLPLSKSLYDFLIAGHFPSAVWQFPIISLGVILLFVSIAAIAAVYAPAKRIRNMSITATINEL